MYTVYTTVPSGDADELVEALLAERLVACVNAVACESTYVWEGDVVCDDEMILFAKTTEEAFESLRERLVDLHPHDVPCIERFDPGAVHGPYEAWVSETVDGQD